jgi:hypothetical protein
LAKKTVFVRALNTKEQGMPSPIKSISVSFVFILFLAFFCLPTAFCAQKPEVNTSNMTGILSIGPDGNIYIQFTKSHAKFTKSTTVGDLIMGKIPEELPLGQADQNELQKAAYIAYNAWERCREAKERAAKGEIPPVQAEWACARAKAMSAEETMIGIQAILDNNLGSEIEWAEPLYEISKIDDENAKQEEQHTIDLGAVPSEEGYQPPGQGFAGGFTPPINLSDPVVNPNKYILDTVPIKDGLSVSPASASR